MQTLPPTSRKQLERTVAEARDAAEEGARAALQALAVGEREPYAHLNEAQRRLRRRLRTHARQLGDRRHAATGEQAIGRLVRECAYERWHGMLFARFLAENGLLIEPELGVSVSLDDCENLAKEAGREGLDKWTLAARFAHGMLPQVFRPDLPVLEVRFAREHRLRLEALAEGLSPEAFGAADALGWVYQFWQARRKDEVNRSEAKIGADELPAVTQLFTEPYMVGFLLDNSLGAWWASRRLSGSDWRCAASEGELRRKAAIPGVPLRYLRFVKQGCAAEAAAWQPAAGAFGSWPERLSELKLLDPCCGSGHFLVAAFAMLVPMRMAAEGLSAHEAVDAVLRDNLHGLEIDARCVEIAAFALALEAWRYPGAGGYRPLPRLRLAWCGQPVAGSQEHWMALANGDSRREAGMALLHKTFSHAQVLGSLMDPCNASGDLLTADFADLRRTLKAALEDIGDDEERKETAVAAKGIAEAAELLAMRYHLVITNVPYLGREKHANALRRFCEERHPLAKHDLATVFVERALALCETDGEACLVLPRNWLFLGRYAALRKHLLSKFRWRLLATLGVGAFETITGEVVNTCLLSIGCASNDGADCFEWIDASGCQDLDAKAEALRQAPATALTHEGQLSNPDSVVGYVADGSHPLLQKRAHSYQGLATSDNAQFVFNFWEVPPGQPGWEFFQFAPSATREMTGCSHVIFWQDGNGKYAEHAAALKREGRLGGWKSGHAAWGKRGIAINRMGDLPASLYFGTKFDCNVAVLIPDNAQDILPIWAYCSSPQYHENVRKLNKKVSVTNGSLAKVPYDAAYWENRANGRDAADLPGVYTTDPTQWGFHGHPRDAAEPLQVAVARLLGYRWPAQTTPAMPLSDRAHFWVRHGKLLESHADRDGIACLPPVSGEASASERLSSLLAACWGREWSAEIAAKLLAPSGAKSLDDWLRDHFFMDHCKLFRNRPFIWHVWDGRRDGFHALVNYHKLAAPDGRGRQLLEALAYSYLGDWITRQRDAMERDEHGAEDRLSAALRLQRRLAAILEGEPPFDIFVRWKPMQAQPIGWEPDIDDGVRLNIRPFMAEDLPGGRRGAGVLRTKPSIHWRKDKGKEPLRDSASFPWFWENGACKGERVNDKHLANVIKQGRGQEAGLPAQHLMPNQEVARA